MIKFIKRLFETKPNMKNIDYSTLKFQPNQKVFVSYYNVWYGWNNVFQPPKNGVIISLGDGLHFKNKHDKNYNFMGNEIERATYWKVKFDCGTFDIPQFHVQDLKKHIEKEKAWMELPHVKKWKEEGFQEDARLKLESQLHASENFLKI